MKVVFWCAACLIAYAYAGYPLWLWFRRRWRTRAVRRSELTPTVSIVMVVRNEAGLIDRKLRNLRGLHYPEDRCEIVVVSDGSTDGTTEVLAEWAKSPRVRVISSKPSRGKAACLNDALAIARGEIVFFTDVRQELEPDCLLLLAENFADPEVGCASGELMLGDPKSGESDRRFGMYWQIEKQIRELESSSGSVIGATGAIYAIRRDLFALIPWGTILDDVFIPMQVVQRGKRVVFDSRARAWDIPHQGTEREFARKVRTLGGNYQLVQLMPWLLGGSNPVRFEFISHKLLRLLVPFALIAVFASSLVLADVFYRTALLLQLLFYALSLLAPAKLKLGGLARAADASFTFVVLNTAAAVAFLKFISGRKAVWGR
jgi:biofilm PGA synthesis N-glycosyltransferase PgaC